MVYDVVDAVVVGCIPVATPLEFNLAEVYVGTHENFHSSIVQRFSVLSLVGAASIPVLGLEEAEHVCVAGILTSSELDVALRWPPACNSPFVCEDVFVVGRAERPVVDVTTIVVCAEVLNGVSAVLPRGLELGFVDDNRV